MSTILGIIADTHGLLRAEAARALQGVDAIIHAGDIGKPAVLDALQRLAPTTAVRGNVDRGGWAAPLPELARIDVHGHGILVLHDLAQLHAPPAGVAVVITGHSHRPCLQRRDGVLFFNPGSAGPRRFRLPVCLGLLSIRAHGIEGRIIDLCPLEGVPANPGPAPQPGSVSGPQAAPDGR